MRFSTKLGTGGLLTGTALAAVAAGIALLQEAATHGPAANVPPSFPEAVISIELLSRAALATGIIALLYALYQHLQRESAPRASRSASAKSLSLRAQRSNLDRVASSLRSSQ